MMMFATRMTRRFRSTFICAGLSLVIGMVIVTSVVPLWSSTNTRYVSEVRRRGRSDDSHIHVHHQGLHQPSGVSSPTYNKTKLANDTQKLEKSYDADISLVESHARKHELRSQEVGKRQMNSDLGETTAHIRGRNGTRQAGHPEPHLLHGVVKMPENGMFHRKTSHHLLMRTDMKDIRKEGWEQSDNLPNDCRKRDYGDLVNWPTASIILAYCDNEHVTDVLHTVHSIVQRTPEVLLHEIILIDDNTEKDEFKATFAIYCSAVFGSKVRILRSNHTLGLIQARLLGARAATGDVIVSMDAHMEVQDLWLEALLWEIRTNRKTLATSALDWMIYNPGEGWTYRAGYSSFMCTFGWSLGFGFGYSRPEIEQAYKKNNTMAIPSPCTVGTIWAMDREFFKNIGELDEGMQKWGGENLDLAIRTWLFGGRAVQVPCSHAAHLERPHQRDYRSGWDTFTNTNYKRVIDVWFDQYKHNVYAENPVLKYVDPGDISSRLELKKRALHNFTWFLDNVFPELGAYDRNTVSYGWAKNLGQNLCLRRDGSNPLTLWSLCSGLDLKEILFMTMDGYLRTDLQTWHGREKQVGSLIGPEGATDTYREPWLSRWIHWKDGPMFLYESDGPGTAKSLCIEGFSGQHVSLQPCDSSKLSQHWQWTTYTEHYDDVLNGKLDTDFHTELLRIKSIWPHVRPPTAAPSKE